MEARRAKQAIHQNDMQTQQRQTTSRGQMSYDMEIKILTIQFTMGTNERCSKGVGIRKCSFRLLLADCVRKVFLCGKLKGVWYSPFAYRCHSLRVKGRNLSST